MHRANGPGGDAPPAGGPALVGGGEGEELVGVEGEAEGVAEEEDGHQAHGDHGQTVLLHGGKTHVSVW